MKGPFVSRRRHQRALDSQRHAYDLYIKQVAGKNRDGLAMVATELSDLKDEVALHIVAAEHPSSALSDARSMAIALREALEARGIDLRVELARLEGADL